MTDAPDWADTAEQDLLDQMLTLVPVHGWTWRCVKAAGAGMGLSEGETELLAPHGPADLAALLARRHDAQAMAALAAIDPTALKVRERIARGCEAWLDAASGEPEATRRWMGFLALPLNLPLGARLAWDSADRLWRWAGDVATDENHYTKRALLGGILTGALAIQQASGQAAALAFVDRRIGNVMSFERWKATTHLKPQSWAHRAAEALSRMRYGA